MARIGKRLKEKLGAAPKSAPQPVQDIQGKGKYRKLQEQGNPQDKASGRRTSTDSVRAVLKG